MTPKGRHTKSKARLSNYENLLSQKSKETEEKLELYIPPGLRLGNNVIDLKELVRVLVTNFYTKT